jgi:inositol-phosphate phosphatase/L-galactose 1-phosphate phosphatase/histidinol-phosphatase
VLREALEKAYPAHGILGEEHPATRQEAEFVWVIDPIDGTQSFISGLPMFGLLLGPAWEERFVLGLIDQPILHERWVGADGHGTNMNGRRVSTRRCRVLREATLYAGGPTRDETAAGAAVARVRDECRGARYGVECYTYGLLASGYIDLILDYDYEAYDFAPLEPVFRNAGGTMTDWQGSRLQFDSEGRVLAAGDPQLLVQVLALLESIPTTQDGF